MGQVLQKLRQLSLKPETSSRVSALLPIVALMLLWGVLIYQLGAQWSAFEQYSYGWAVPFLCAYMIWEAWSKERESWRSSAVSPASASQSTANCPPPTAHCLRSTVHLNTLLLVVLSGLAYIPVRFLHEASPTWRATSWAWALLAVAVTLSFVNLHWGKGAMKRFTFPVLFFLVAVPWPTAAEHWLIGTLTKWNSILAVEILGHLNVPAVLHGNVIEITTGQVGIDEACSGIRSVQATLMISLFLGQLYRFELARRVSLVSAGLLLAFLCNVGRTTLLTYVAATKGVAAIAQWHDPAGVAILVACFLGLWLTALWLRDKEERRRVGGSSGFAETAVPESAGSGGFAETALPDAPLGNRRATLKWVSVSLIAWVVLTEIGVEAWYRLHEITGAAPVAWTVRWPEQANYFENKPLSESVSKQMMCDVGSRASWESEGARWQGFYFEWKPSRSLYDRARVNLSKVHVPETCLAGAGMKRIAELEPKPVNTAAGITIPFRRYIFEAGGQPLYVFFAIVEDGRSGFEGLYRSTPKARIQAALAGSRNYGQRTIEIAIHGVADEAEALEVLRRELPPMIVTW